MYIFYVPHCNIVVADQESGYRQTGNSRMSDLSVQLVCNSDKCETYTLYVAARLLPPFRTNVVLQF